MAATGPKFADLVPRIISALVLLLVGGAGLWFGGMVLAVLLSILGAAMLWEYFRLIVRLAPRIARAATGVTALLLAVSLVLEDVFAIVENGRVLAPAPIALIVLAICMCAVVALVRKSKLETIFGAMIPLGTFLFFYVHQSSPFVMWLVVAIIVATDVSGYFFGKLIGGPKFWPALSPNKTWSGAGAGWVAAAIIAVAVSWGEGAAAMLLNVAFLVLVSFAAQMADIAESALKRRAGVKDSSNLLPGHGGVLDRFDGMIGGFVMAGLVFLIFGHFLSVT
ncbi:MAG: phosphatidate cytidylyltransferase [Roseicyclus sp.]|nr:phosphatidate cytidylyltransferase [Roseicyclus sp.]